MRGFIEHTKSVPGAADILKKLKSKYVLGLVTNSLAENTLIDLEITGMAEYFKTITISSQVGYCKPHPLIYQTAVLSLDLRMEEVCFIGDNWDEDVIGPTQQGMQAIWVKTPRKQKEGWRAQDFGVAVAEKLEQVLGILGVEESEMLV
jgi:putative hydrolase of the HAD superfamily